MHPPEITDPVAGRLRSLIRKMKTDSALFIEEMSDALLSEGFPVAFHLGIISAISARGGRGQFIIGYVDPV